MASPNDDADFLPLQRIVLPASASARDTGSLSSPVKAEPMEDKMQARCLRFGCSVGEMMEPVEIDTSSDMD